MLNTNKAIEELEQLRDDVVYNRISKQGILSTIDHLTGFTLPQEDADSLTVIEEVTVIKEVTEENYYSPTTFDIAVMVANLTKTQYKALKKQMGECSYDEFKRLWIREESTKQDID